MPRRHVLLATATTAVLALGLPALGSLLPVYSLSFDAAGEAYVTVDGACGFVDPAVPEGERRRLTFCFGDTVEGAVHPGGGSAGIVAMWVRDLQCVTVDGGESCDEQRHTLSPDEVDFTVSPLLDAAEANSTDANVSGCLVVDLSLTAISEPLLRSSESEVSHFVDPSPDGFGGGVSWGPGSASVGRDATVSGTLCGVTIGEGEGSGRILRGLGTTGGQAGFDVK